MKALTPSVTFKGKIELKKYSQKNMIQCWQPRASSYMNSRLIKDKKTLESSRALEARVAIHEVKTDNSSNESLFADVKPKANNRNNSALDRKGNSTRQSCADT